MSRLECARCGAASRSWAALGAAGSCERAWSCCWPLLDCRRCAAACCFTAVLVVRLVRRSQQPSSPAAQEPSAHLAASLLSAAGTLPAAARRPARVAAASLADCLCCRPAPCTPDAPCTGRLTLALAQAPAQAQHSTLARTSSRPTYTHPIHPHRHTRARTHTHTHAWRPPGRANPSEGVFVIIGLFHFSRGPSALGRLRCPQAPRCSACPPGCRIRPSSAAGMRNCAYGRQRPGCSFRPTWRLPSERWLRFCARRSTGGWGVGSGVSECEIAAGVAIASGSGQRRS